MFLYRVRAGVFICCARVSFPPTLWGAYPWNRDVTIIILPLDVSGIRVGILYMIFFLCAIVIQYFYFNNTHNLFKIKDRIADGPPRHHPALVCRWRWGGRHLKGDMETHGQIYGERATTRLLPGSNQEHLGRVSPERPAGGGLLLGLRNPYRDREPLPRGLLGVTCDRT